MAIGLCKELHTACLVHLLQFLNDLRGVHLQLLDARTRQGEGHLEILAVLLDHVVERVECGHITALGNIGDATLVLVVIIIIMIGTDVEETVALQMDNLMYLEI